MNNRAAGTANLLYSGNIQDAPATWTASAATGGKMRQVLLMRPSYFDINFYNKQSKSDAMTESQRESQRQFRT